MQEFDDFGIKWAIPYLGLAIISAGVAIIYYNNAPSVRHIEVAPIANYIDAINNIDYCVIDTYSRIPSDIFTFNHKREILPIDKCQEFIKTNKVD